MSIATTVDSAGRIVLPIEIRRRLGIVAGSRLNVAVVAERVELTPEAEPAAEFMLSPGKRRVLKPTGVAFDAAAAIRGERDEQMRRRIRK